MKIIAYGVGNQWRHFSDVIFFSVVRVSDIFHTRPKSFFSDKNCRYNGKDEMP